MDARFIRGTLAIFAAALLSGGGLWAAASASADVHPAGPPGAVAPAAVQAPRSDATAVPSPPPSDGEVTESPVPTASGATSSTTPPGRTPSATPTQSTGGMCGTCGQPPV